MLITYPQAVLGFYPRHLLQLLVCSRAEASWSCCRKNRIEWLESATDGLRLIGNDGDKLDLNGRVARKAGHSDGGPAADRRAAWRRRSSLAKPEDASSPIPFDQGTGALNRLNRRLTVLRKVKADAVD